MGHESIVLYIYNVCTCTCTHDIHVHVHCTCVWLEVHVHVYTCSQATGLYLNASESIRSVHIAAKRLHNPCSVYYNIPTHACALADRQCIYMYMYMYIPAAGEGSIISLLCGRREGLASGVRL